jgi:hypothetical protein
VQAATSGRLPRISRRNSEDGNDAGDRSTRPPAVTTSIEARLVPASGTHGATLSS